MQTNSLIEFQKIAQDFVIKLFPLSDKATVVGLYGNLGAGKTTFVQTVARSLGVEETVTSPTFVIEKIYDLSSLEPRVSNFDHLIHIDAYRLEKSEELLHLGWQEIVSDSKNLILIEWPERVAEIMPRHINVSLKTIENPDSRQIEIEY